MFPFLYIAAQQLALLESAGCSGKNCQMLNPPLDLNPFVRGEAHRPYAAHNVWRF